VKIRKEEIILASSSFDDVSKSISVPLYVAKKKECDGIAKG
jgi:hypothetical protein